MKKPTLYVKPEIRQMLFDIAMICDEKNILHGFTGDDYLMLLIACQANNKNLNLAWLKEASHEEFVSEIIKLNNCINVDSMKLEDYKHDIE